jgi:hypothetical protein
VTKLGRVLRARRAGRDERGSVLVEAAIIVPLLIMLTFGAIEYGIAFRDSAEVASSTRAGARIASTLTLAADACAPGVPECTAFAPNIAASVEESLKDLTSATPTMLVIYKADENGNPPGITTNPLGWAGCHDCFVYDWDASAKKWINEHSSNPWSQDERLLDVCHGTLLPTVGVYVVAKQQAITRLFGPSRTFHHKTAMRLEPPAPEQCNGV